MSKNPDMDWFTNMVAAAIEDRHFKPWGDERAGGGTTLAKVTGIPRSTIQRWSKGENLKHIRNAAILINKLGGDFSRAAPTYVKPLKVEYARDTVSTYQKRKTMENIMGLPSKPPKLPMIKDAVLHDSAPTKRKQPPVFGYDGLSGSELLQHAQKDTAIRTSNLMRLLTDARVRDRVGPIEGWQFEYLRRWFQRTGDHPVEDYEAAISFMENS